MRLDGMNEDSQTQGTLSHVNAKTALKTKMNDPAAAPIEVLFWSAATLDSAPKRKKHMLCPTPPTIRTFLRP